MTTLKHTPGPWTTETRTGPTIHVTGDRRGPGGVYKHEPGRIVAFVHDDADAHLIAAAPELLDIARRLDAISDRIRFDDLPREFMDLCVDAACCVAKAEGRT